MSNAIDTPRPDTASFIAENPIFYSLSRPVIKSIASKLITRQYQPDEIIFRENDPGDSFHIIREGHVRAVQIREGRELVLSEMGFGEGFGEMALMSDQPRSATIRAVDNVETLVLLRNDFDILYRQLPELAMQMETLKRQRVSLLESADLDTDQSDKFTVTRHIDLDYSYLDSLMKLNEASGGTEQVEHCKETGQLAREMSKILCPMVSEVILFAGYLHEIGKISLPYDLIVKERCGNPLTAEETEKFRNIYQIAVDILSPNKPLCDSLYFLRFLGENDYRDMPLEAQILRVANDFLEFRSVNYKNLPDEEALERMREGSGTIYQPQVITALEKNIDKYKDIRVEAQLNVMRMMIIALDGKDNYTFHHSMDVRNVGLALADRLGLARKEREYIRIGAELHDVGKIFIDEIILNAPRKLTDEERAIMETHSSRSADFFANIFGMDELANIVRSHHEKYNGAGYPKGLKGQEIPFVARIMAIADVWSALTTPRPYRQPASFPAEKALAIMEDMMAGGHFDPDLFPVFREYVIEEFFDAKSATAAEPNLASRP